MSTHRNRAALLAVGIIVAVVALLATRRPSRADVPPAAGAQRWEYATYEVEMTDGLPIHTWNDGTHMIYKPSRDDLYLALAGAAPAHGPWLPTMFNLVGKSGWELVTIDVEQTAPRANRREYIFKRPAR